MTSDISISIIIPAKNEAKYLKLCLNSLFISLKRCSHRYEVILVDNESTDDTVLIGISNQCKVISSDGDTIGKHRNLGAASANGSILGFLDADCLVSPDWVSLCIENFSDDSIVAVGTRARPNPATATWVERSVYSLMAGAARPNFVEWLGTSNLFVRREVFFQVGGFDERLKTGEDVNLCRKLRQGNDYKIRLEKRINTVHMRESKTLRELFRREFQRGKHSLKSTVASGFPLKEVPSIAVPGMNLVGLGLAIGFAAACPVLAIILASICFSFPMIFLLRKRIRIVFEVQLLHCYIVAFMYILARSLALAYEICEYAILRIRRPKIGH